MFSKLLYADDWTPVSLYFLALLVVTIFLAVHELLQSGEEGRWDMSAEDIKGILLTTVVGGVISPLLYFTALAHVRASDAVLLVGLLPFFTVVFAVLMLKEHFTMSSALGGCMLLLGVGALLWPDIQSTGFNWWSLALAGSSVTAALTTILHKKYVKCRHLDSVVLVRATLSIVCIGLWMLLTEPQSFDLFLQPQQMGLVFGFPMLGLLAPFFLFFGALRHITALEAGLISGAGPVAGVVFAAAFLGEAILPYQYLSLTLVLIGIFTINIPLTRWRIVPSRPIEMGPLGK
jgi:drug/metabolite transporter (DMT)-like permease